MKRLILLILAGLILNGCGSKNISRMYIAGKARKITPEIASKCKFIGIFNRSLETGLFSFRISQVDLITKVLNKAASHGGNAYIILAQDEDYISFETYFCSEQRSQ